jgi:hypothetical protein
MNSKQPEPRACPQCQATMQASEREYPSPGYDTYLCQSCPAVVFVPLSRAADSNGVGKS